MADQPDSVPDVSMSIKPAHFPGRAPVDSYGGGGFRFAEMSHKGSILCLPSGVYGWSASSPEDFTLKAFEQVMAETGIEVLLVGTGTDLVPIPPNVRNLLAKNGIRADPMSTGAAARTFNVLLGEGRAVGAALLAVD